MKIEGAKFVAVWIQDDDPGDMDPGELLCRHAIIELPVVPYVQPLHEAVFIHTVQK